jgi:hypothetical protein
VNSETLGSLAHNQARLAASEVEMLLVPVACDFCDRDATLAGAAITCESGCRDAYLVPSQLRYEQAPL